VKENEVAEEGYEGEFILCLFSSKKKLKVVPSSNLAARDGERHVALPAPAPIPLLFPRCLFLFLRARPRVPRDAFGAPCLVIRVMYGALIAHYDQRQPRTTTTRKSIT
jgi:hypothetical protein